MGAVLEYMLVIIAVVAALVAIIVNRKSLLACIVITAVSAALCLGFLLLYANTHRLGPYGGLGSFTITCASVLTVILIVVTFIGVKMHYKKKPAKAKKEAAQQLPFEVQTPARATASAVQSDVASRFGVRPTPVGIFGRQPIDKEKVAAEAQPAVQPTPIFNAAPVPSVVPASDDAALQRMLKKGDQFAQMKQFLLAEQMFTTFIQRCDDQSKKIDAELKLLACHMNGGDRDKAASRLNDMVSKMRSGEYVFSVDQKRTLAECKMRLMKV